MANTVVKTIEINVDAETGIKTVDELTKSFDELGNQVGDTEQVTKKYNKQLDNTGKEAALFSDHLDKMTGGLVGTVKGLWNSVKGLKAFKVALAATGLGLIAIVIGTVVAAFKKLQGPISFVEDLMAGVDAAFNAALKQLSTFANAFLQFVQGNWVLAIALIKTGVQEIVDSYKDGSDLSKAQRAFNTREAERNVIIAKNNQLIEEQKLLYEDSTKSSIEREKAAKIARDLAIESVRLEKLNEQERIINAKQLFELSTKNDQDRIDFLQIQSAAYEKIAGTAGRVVEINNAYNTVLDQIKS